MAARLQTLLHAGKATADAQLPGAQKDFVTGKVQRLHSGDFGLLLAKTVTHLPNFVSEVVVDNRAPCESKIVEAGYEMPIQRC